MARVLLILIISLTLWLRPSAAGASAHDTDLLSRSIQDLLTMEVTSVAKRAQKLSEAPAAVTLLSSEDIRRSGMTNVPDLLRMVPGLHVANIDSSTWAITARGFNSQFANKLLVMIDGRSVYTPMFSGVYWDVQGVMLEDIDRIEVVRGPGGTLWGANAVNGVINIITKEASGTQGLLVSGVGGSPERGSAAMRYGGALGDDAHYRAYVTYFERDAFDDRDGIDANDGWDTVRGGFRFDWDLTDDDHLTLQGDYYDGEASETNFALTQSDIELSGGNVLARWVHAFSEASNLQLQLYYDRTERNGSLLGEDRDTFDLEFQHRFSPLPRNHLVWGVGYRVTADDIQNSLAVKFDPTERTIHLANGFLQDEVTLIPDRLTLTLGSKFEYNDYTGFEFQPSVRALWTPHERHSAWVAFSRAIRAPSRAENDVSLLVPFGTPPPDFNLLAGSEDFDSEDLLAYEVGYRGHLLDRVFFDVAAYYHEYDDLRAIKPGAPIFDFPAPGLITVPLPGENLLDARGYGVEVGVTWSVTDFWRLIGTYTLMKLDIDPDGASADPTAEDQEHDTPDHQFNLRSLIDLPRNFELDTTLYYVGKVSNQNIDDYVRLDVRLGWRPIANLELSLVGQNLTERRHDEFGTSFTRLPTSVPRSVYGMMTVRY